MCWGWGPSVWRRCAHSHSRQDGSTTANSSPDPICEPSSLPSHRASRHSFRPSTNLGILHLGGGALAGGGGVSGVRGHGHALQAQQGQQSDLVRARGVVGLDVQGSCRCAERQQRRSGTVVRGQMLRARRVLGYLGRLRTRHQLCCDVPSRPSVHGTSPCVLWHHAHPPACG